MRLLIILSLIFMSIVLYGADRKSIYDFFFAGDGAASTPSISFNGDKDTGIYKSGTDELSISTGGTNALTIDSSQNLILNSNISIDSSGNLTTNDVATFGTLGVGAAPDSSAQFDITTTSKVSKPYGAMTETQRDNISTPASGGQVFNSTTGFINYYSTTWKELIDDSSTQSLSNKTFSDAITLTEISTPTTPSSGEFKIYPKSDNKLYYLDDTGSETEVGSGSGGSGSKNYISEGNSKFESGVGDWATFDDATAFVDGVSGTASNLTLSVTSTSGEVLENTQSMSLAKGAANAQYEGVSVPTTTIDPQDYGNALFGTFNINTDVTNYATGDLKLFAYDITNSQTLLVQCTFDENCEIPVSDGRQKLGYQVYLDGTSGSETAQVRLSLMVNSTNASAWEVFLDSVTLGPEGLYPGAIVTEPISYSPTVTGFGTLTNDEFTYHRVGANLYIQGKFTAGTTAASTAGISLPSGMVVKSTGITTNYNAGYMLRGAASSAIISYAIIDNGATEVQFSARGSNNPLTAADGNAILDTGNDATVNLGPIPIEGWSASNLMSKTEAFFKNASLIVGGTPTSTLSGSFSDIVWPNVEKDRLNIYDNTTGEITIPETGLYFVGVTNEQSATATATSNTYGIELYNKTQADSIIRTRKNPYAGSGTVVLAPKMFEMFEANKDDVIVIRSQNNATSPSYVTSYEGQRLVLASWKDIITYGAYAENKKYQALDSTSQYVGSPSLGTWYTPITSWNVTIPQGVYDLDLKSYVNIISNTTSGLINYKVALATSSTPGTGIIDESVALGVAVQQGTRPAEYQGIQTSVLKYIASSETTLYVQIQPMNVSGGSGVTIGIRNDVEGGYITAIKK